MNTKKALFINAFFGQHQPGLKRFIIAKFGGNDEADDLVQDAFQKFMSLDNPDELENPKAYIYQIAHNLALNRIRKQGRQVDFEKAFTMANDEGGSSSPEVIIAGREELDLVMQQLQQLPEKVRRAFMLSRAENLKYDEISQQMGVSVSSVEKYLITALKHLRKTIPLRD